MQLFALKQAMNGQQAAAAVLLQAVGQSPTLPHLGNNVDAVA